MIFKALRARESGGVALEYVIVSIFGLLMSLFAVGYVSKVAKKHLDKASEKTGVKPDDFNFDF